MNVRMYVGVSSEVDGIQASLLGSFLYFNSVPKTLSWQIVFCVLLIPVLVKLGHELIQVKELPDFGNSLCVSKPY